MIKAVHPDAPEKVEAIPAVLYSVLMPVHRLDAYLPAAIDSVEAAMGEDRAELVLVANGPERSELVDFLDRPGGKARQVLSCKLPSLVHALNVGLEACRGLYVLRMDSDDLCDPDRFRRQIDVLARGGVDLLFSDVQLIDQDGGYVDERTFHYRMNPDFGDSRLYHPTLAIRRDTLVALGGYGNVEGAEDRELWLAALGRGYRFRVLPEKLVHYRLHRAQVTQQDHGWVGRINAVSLDMAYALRWKRNRVLVVTLAKVVYLLAFRTAKPVIHRIRIAAQGRRSRLRR